MIGRYLFIVMMVLALTECKTAELYHFIHAETEFDRKSLQWSKSDPQLASELAINELPYFVVDFYSFWPGYSATAYLYVVQRSDDDPIEFTSITVRSSETSETHTSLLNVEASPKLVGSGFHLYRYRVLDVGASGKFSEANSLQVTLEWLAQDKAKASITIDVKRKTKSEAVWPT
jgi:hypothetical protein